MRITSVFLGSILVAFAAVAQNPPDHSGMSSKMGQQQNMSAMHDQMMKGMQADLDSMRSKLQKMKDQLNKISDQSTKDQFQLNIEMWQSVIDDMDKHITMMKQMMGPGQNMMMHEHRPPAPKK
ncbi:MAG TPA: hypothetical protein VJA94_23505 [Candidatus Angelobacter sp.]